MDNQSKPCCNLILDMLLAQETSTNLPCRGFGNYITVIVTKHCSIVLKVLSLVLSGS